VRTQDSSEHRLSCRIARHDGPSDVLVVAVDDTENNSLDVPSSIVSLSILPLTPNKQGIGPGPIKIRVYYKRDGTTDQGIVTTPEAETWSTKRFMKLQAAKVWRIASRSPPPSIAVVIFPYRSVADDTDATTVDSVSSEIVS
jgi:hypothetical protein